MQRFILKSANIFFRKGATGSHHLLLSNKMTVTTLCIGRAKSTSSTLSKTSLDFGANNHSAGGGIPLSVYILIRAEDFRLCTLEAFLLTK